MKKLILSVAVIAALSPAAFADTVEITINSPIVYTSNGSKVEKSELAAAAYIENDITMVPLRFVSEKLGANVDWNGETKEVKCEKGGKTVKLKIGDTNASKSENGQTQSVSLPTAPIILNDLTLVPLRFVSEGLGAEVEYIAPSRQVLISDYSASENNLGKIIATVGDTKIDGGLFNAFYQSNLYYIPYYGAESYLNVVYDNILVESAVADEWKKLGYEFTFESEALAELEQISDDDLMQNGVLKANLVKMSEMNQIVNLLGEQIYETVTVEDAEKYYKENYICAKHILFTTTDSQTGEPLNKADIKKKAEAVLKRLKKGEDFDKLMAELSEDPGSKSNPDGYVFTTSEMVEEFENAAFALKENEISDLVESVYGYHIIKKEQLPEMTDSVKNDIAQIITSKSLLEFSTAAQSNILVPAEDIYDEITPESYK